MCVLPRKVSSCDHKMDVCYALGSMAIPVVQFSMEGYKFEKVFGYKFTVVKWTSWILRIGVMGSCRKVPKFDFQSQFSTSKIIWIWIVLKNTKLGAHFLFLLTLCSIKIERLLFLKVLKNLSFFDSYFWPFNKSEEKNQGHFCNQCNYAFNLKCFYQIPLTWWKIYTRTLFMLNADIHV